MSDTSTHLLLPYLLASQAQKHVTHNEALRILDAVTQLAVLDRDLTVPPGSPADGDRYIVAAGATGAWSGWDLSVAHWSDGAWFRLLPRPGWIVWVVDEASFRSWNGSAWIPLASFAGGVTLNKPTAGDSVAVEFQTGGSGRAQIGTLGSDDLVMRTSIDGSAWTTALRLDDVTGTVSAIQRLIAGDSAAGVSVGAGANVFSLQVLGPDFPKSSLLMARWTAGAGGPNHSFAKSRGAAIGSTGIVSNNDSLGSMVFYGDDGTGFPVGSASITARVDGAPGAGDVPGRLEFSTSISGTSTIRAVINSAGELIPGADNTQKLGSASRRWSEVFAGNGTINTSDERSKEQIEDLPDDWLAAWGDVRWRRYRFRDAVARKGDRARWHAGLIAQEVQRAFADRGLDAFAIGLLCYDEWPATTAVEYDQAGAVVRETSVPAGSAFGLRYEECMAIEAAYQRRQLARLARKIDVVANPIP